MNCLTLLLLLASFPLLSTPTLTPPSHLESSRQLLIIPSSPKSSQIFTISFSKTYQNETRMLTYGIDQYQTDTLFTQYFQTDLISLSSTTFMLNISTFNTITIKGLAIRFIITQNQPNLYNQYYYVDIGNSTILYTGTGLRQMIFYLDAPISFYSSNNTIVLPFLEGYKMNSTSHVIRISTSNPKRYVSSFKYQQEFMITTDQDCKISYFSFNILFVNVEELQREGYYVSGGHYVIYNQVSGKDSFGYAIEDYASTTVLIGVNGFGTAQNRSIYWDVIVDTNKTWLLLEKQNIDQIYYSFLQIGLLSKNNNCPAVQAQSKQTSKDPYLFVVIVILIVLLGVIIMTIICRRPRYKQNRVVNSSLNEAMSENDTTIQEKKIRKGSESQLSQSIEKYGNR